MRILFVSRKFPPSVGGMETWSAEVLENLQSRHSVKSAIMKQDDSRLLHVLRLLPFIAYWTVFAFLKRNEFDRIILGDILLWPVGLMTHRPTCISLHGKDMTILGRISLIVGIYKIYLTVFKWLRPNVRMVANSGATEAAASAFFTSHQILMCHLGVNLRPVPSFLQVSPEIVYYGRIMERKGALWFAENVMPSVSKQIRLKVIGPVWEKSYFEDLIECDRVDYAGVIPNGLDDLHLRETIASAMCCILPNRPMLEKAGDIEGFGLVAIELASLNSHVIASDLDGFRESIRDGETGFLVDANSPAIWCKAIEDAENATFSSRIERVEKIRELLSQDYSWETYIEVLLAA